MSRRALGTIAVALSALLLVVVILQLDGAVHRLALPLRHASVIREQASAKHLDPALIAAVIYAESKFDPRPSPAGAQGLMQILPETAYFIAHLSGGSRFTASDSSTKAAAASAMPNHSAARGAMRPAGTGRVAVRAMRASMSRSQ